MDKHYQVLGLRPGSTLKEIRQAYRDLVRVWHPDRFAHDARLCMLAEEKLKEINIAYEALERHLSSGRPGGQGDFSRAPASGSPPGENKAHADFRAERKHDPSQPQQKEQASRPPAPARTERVAPVFLPVIMVCVVIAVVLLYLLYPIQPPDEARVGTAVNSMPGDASPARSTVPKGPATLPAGGASRDAGVRIATHSPPHAPPSTTDVVKEKKTARRVDDPKDAALIQEHSVAMEEPDILKHAGGGGDEKANWRYLGRTQNGEFCYGVNSVNYLTPTRFTFWIRIKVLGDERVRVTADLKKHTARYDSLMYMLGYNEIDAERGMWRRILIHYTDDRYAFLHTWDVPEKWNYLPDRSIIEKALKEIQGVR
jgi:hypothetical protein